MATRLIYVPGCDDSTKVVMDLTDDEFATIAKVAEAVTAAGGGCAPQMFLATDGEPSDFDHMWPECSTCYRNWGSCECEGGPSA